MVTQEEEAIEKQWNALKKETIKRVKSISSAGEYLDHTLQEATLSLAWVYGMRSEEDFDRMVSEMIKESKRIAREKILGSN